MAAKKNTTKSALSKSTPKPVAKPSKGVPAKKPAASTKKPAASAKKPATPAKKPAASVKKPAVPAKKPAAPTKKPVTAAKKTAATEKKPVAPAKKVFATATKSAALEKKPSAPAKKPGPPAKTLASPAKKASPLKKALAPNAETKITPPTKSSPTPKAVPAIAVVEVAPEPPAKAIVPIPKKTPAVKPRSSVVDYPAPPAPIKPPFVPPKAAPAPSGEIVAPGSNGTHTPAFIQKQRQRLLDLRDDLVDAVSGMARDTIRNAPEGSEASGSGQHQGDAGSDAYDRDFALSVLAKEQDALYEIEQALRRIQSGSYGICEMSNRKIPQARLEAIPFARLTVECQAQWEKEYGNRRFRPSNEVGFSGGNYAEDEDSETVSLDEDDD